jgi:hypothetical protein
MQVLIPQWWWKANTENEQLDYRAELLACLDTAIAGNPVFNPLTLGTLALLELIDSQCWHNPATAPAISWGRALFIVNNRISALLAVVEYITAGKQDSAEVDFNLKLDVEAAKICKDNFDNFNFDALRLSLKTQIEVAVSGFKMIPCGTGSSLPESGFLFGSTFIVPHATRATALLNVTYFEALWSVPLAAIAQAEAIDFLRNDSKGRGISRPKDNTSGDRVMKECEERAIKGELQPWQYLDPEHYKPTIEQIKINPEIINQHAELLKVKNG